MGLPGWGEEFHWYFINSYSIFSPPSVLSTLLHFFILFFLSILLFEYKWGFSASSILKFIFKKKKVKSTVGPYSLSHTLVDSHTTSSHICIQRIIIITTIYNFVRQPTICFFLPLLIGVEEKNSLGFPLPLHFFAPLSHPLFDVWRLHNFCPRLVFSMTSFLYLIADGWALIQSRCHWID